MGGFWSFLSLERKDQKLSLEMVLKCF